MGNKAGLETIKKLRQMTSAGMTDCQKALVEADGNIDEAVAILRKKGAALASKKAARATQQGRIEAYIHLGGKLGVLVEVNCETDFVAKNEEFKKFTKDIAMQIAASAPAYVKREDVPADVVEKEKEIFASQIDSKKPKNVVEKIIEGKLDKFYAAVCLLEQPFIKDDKITIKDYLTQQIGKIGENMSINRFTRFAVGEE